MQPVGSSCTKKDGFQEKGFKSYHNTFATKQWQKRCSIILLFCSQKEHWEVSDIPRKRAFHLNKAHCLKPYIRSSVYRDEKLQFV